MKTSIRSIPQLYRNAKRWTEIASVLSKYGLANWMDRFNIDFISDRLKTADGEKLKTLTHSCRVRLALTELGSSFIKFGQLLGTRPDLIGTEMADELSKLQSQAPADDFETVRAIIEGEQGKTIEQLFHSFDPEPFASASIGQAHHATINADDYEPFESLAKSGSNLIEVVVKIRHEGIDRVLEADLDILSGVAQLAERLDDFQNYQPASVVRDLSQTMRRELDFEREHRNLLQFRDLLQSDPSVKIPQPISPLCSSKMLTMERINGRPLKEFGRDATMGGRCDLVAKQGAELYLKMIFTHGFFHADPHPGNILIMEDDTIGLLDFGMVGRVSEHLRESIESMLVAIVNRDVTLLTSLVKRVGSCPKNLNESAMSNDLADFVGQYSSQAVGDFDMSGALNDFVDIVQRYGISLPSEASLLIKVLVTLEGTGRILNPNFSLMEIMRPFHRMMLIKRLSPMRQMRKMQRFYIGLEQLADVLPQRLTTILEQIQTGHFDVNIEHRRLGPSVNRLVMGMITSALFLGSALMLSFKVPPVLFPGEGWFGVQDLSLLGLLGVAASMMMGFRLVWAIRKSGNLDQVD
jgi:ubiquinone biosynthesis protein